MSIQDDVRRALGEILAGGAAEARAKQANARKAIGERLAEELAAPPKGGALEALRGLMVARHQANVAAEKKAADDAAAAKAAEAKERDAKLAAVLAEHDAKTAAIKRELDAKARELFQAEVREEMRAIAERRQEKSKQPLEVSELRQRALRAVNERAIAAGRGAKGS